MSVNLVNFPFHYIDVYQGVSSFFNVQDHCIARVNNGFYAFVNFDYNLVQFILYLIFFLESSQFKIMIE